MGIEPDTLPIPGHQINRAIKSSRVVSPFGWIAPAWMERANYEMDQDGRLRPHKRAIQNCRPEALAFTYCGVDPRGDSELANFDNNERNVICEKPVPPSRHAVDDGLPHVGQFQICRVED
jgi:hypothetical protein